jgi:hypothetical protein
MPKSGNPLCTRFWGQNRQTFQNCIDCTQPAWYRRVSRLSSARSITKYSRTRLDLVKSFPWLRLTLFSSLSRMYSCLSQCPNASCPWLFLPSLFPWSKPLCLSFTVVVHRPEPLTWPWSSINTCTSQAKMSCHANWVIIKDHGLGYLCTQIVSRFGFSKFIDFTMNDLQFEMDKVTTILVGQCTCCICEDIKKYLLVLAYIRD